MKCFGCVPQSVVVVLIGVVIQFLLYSSILSDNSGIHLESAFQERRDRESSYDVKPLNSPRLQGTPLRLAVMLIHTPIIGDIILSLLMKNNNFQVLQRFASTLEPTTIPLFFPWNPRHRFFQTPEEATESLNPFQHIFEFDAAAPSLSRDNGAHPFWTINDYTSRYKSKALNPTEAIQRVLLQIQSSNSISEKNPIPLRAFLRVNETDALHQAAASTARYQSGTPLSPLDGVPVAIKDDLSVIGYYKTYGSTLYQNRNPSIATQDSIAVGRLRDAGAIIVGIANMHEFGIGTTGYNPHFGTPLNPYDIRRFPGGSSSGPASAVASGLVPMALGSDGGGSIRIPAALCGMFGLKSTFGRVPHINPMSVNHIGPITNNAKDAALAYSIISGPHQGHPGTEMQPPVRLSSQDWKNTIIDDKKKRPSSPPPLEGLKIGIYKEYFEDAHPEIVSSSYSVLDHFVKDDIGAKLVNITIPNLDLLKIAHATTILSELAVQHTTSWYNASQLVLDSQILMALGRRLKSRDYIAAAKVRTYFMNFFSNHLFIQHDNNDDENGGDGSSSSSSSGLVDVIVTPGTSVVAPKMPLGITNEPTQAKGGLSDVTQTGQLMKYILIGNFLGLPAIVFPIGYIKEDSDLPIPMSMQIIGRHWDEDILLKIAKVAEQFLLGANGGMEKPQRFYNVLG